MAEHVASKMTSRRIKRLLPGALAHTWGQQHGGFSPATFLGLQYSVVAGKELIIGEDLGHVTNVDGEGPPDGLH